MQLIAKQQSLDNKPMLRRFIFLSFSLWLLLSALAGQAQEAAIPVLSNCPALSITPSAQEVRSGEIIKLKASVKDYTNASNLNFNWHTIPALPDGINLQGQGTAEVTLDTNGMFDTVMEFVVEITNTDFPINCSRSAKTTVQVRLIGDRFSFDSFGKLEAKDLEVRLDIAAIALLRNYSSDFAIYFEMDNGTRQRRDYAKRWFERAKNYLIKRHRISAERIKAAQIPKFNATEDFQVNIWILPAKSAGLIEFK